MADNPRPPDNYILLEGSEESPWLHSEEDKRVMYGEVKETSVIIITNKSCDGATEYLKSYGVCGKVCARTWPLLVRYPTRSHAHGLRFSSHRSRMPCTVKGAIEPPLIIMTDAAQVTTTLKEFSAMLSGADWDSPERMRYIYIPRTSDVLEISLLDLKLGQLIIDPLRPVFSNPRVRVSIVTSPLALMRIRTTSGLGAPS